MIQSKFGGGVLCIRRMKMYGGGVKAVYITLKASDSVDIWRLKDFIGSAQRLRSGESRFAMD